MMRHVTTNYAIRWIICCFGALLIRSMASAAIQDVGHHEDSVQTPVNQKLTPFGQQIQLPGLRPQAIALSPDGSILVVSGKSHELVVVGIDDDGVASIEQNVPLPADTQTEPLVATDHELKPDRNAQLSYNGLIFSKDGSRIYMSNVNGSIKVFAVDAKHDVKGSYSISLPPADAPRRKAEIPSGLALSADQTKLYVCGNLSNRLLEIDLSTKQVTRTFDVGVAPYDVQLVGSKAFVSNWGGRRPNAGDLVGPAGRGTIVRVDPVHYVASEGSVSIVDLESGKVVDELITGLHASALVVSSDGRFVVCANAASDTLTVIDVESNGVVDTIWTKPSPADLFTPAPTH